MNDAKRACVAFVCCMLKYKNFSYSSIYDYKRGRHCLFGSGSSGKNYVSVYDFDRKGFFQGNMPTFFDFVTSSHIHIREESNTMSGYDFETGQFFSVSFVDSVVNVYDFQYSTTFTYLVS